jgi:anthranilate synthase component 2
MSTPRILVLDHRDSFVFLLVEQFRRLGAEARVLRTSISLQDLEAELSTHDPDLVLLSPGPGHPKDSGVMLPFLETRPDRPILGVCLGHQAMALAAGGEVGHAPSPVHGKSSQLVHEGDPLFAGTPRQFPVARYHSLTITKAPAELEVIARCADEPEVIFAVRHRTLPHLGLQFHPESVLSPQGAPLVRTILDQATTIRAAQRKGAAHP